MNTPNPCLDAFDVSSVNNDATLQFLSFSSSFSFVFFLCWLQECMFTKFAKVFFP